MLTILLVTVFFYGEKPAETRAMVAPALNACMAAGPQVKKRLEGRSDVRVVKWACLGVPAAGDKA